MDKLPANKRGRYYIQHKKHIGKRTKLNLNDIKAGMPLLITYKSDHRLAQKESIYVCLQPKFHNFLHVIDLDYIQPNKLDLLVKLTRTKQPTLVEGLQTLEFTAKDAGLYAQISKLAGIKESYRQLHRDSIHIKSIEHIEFDFSPQNKEVINEDQLRDNVQK